MALTILKGGVKVNVIPPESEASFDARILPEEQHEHFLAQVQKVGGKDVEVVPVDRGRVDSFRLRYGFFQGHTACGESAKGEHSRAPLYYNRSYRLAVFQADRYNSIWLLAHSPFPCGNVEHALH